MVKFSRTTFEMGFSLPVMSAGAVPLTAKTVKFAVVAFPKKPGTDTIQLLKVRMRPFVFVMSLIWKTPARFVFGPCNGVPAIVGVVDSSTTRPGAAASGPGWNDGACGSLNAAV